jgi:hypothetical protein
MLVSPIRVERLSGNGKGAAMKKLIASSLVTLLTATLLAAAPATAEASRKTELINGAGAGVDALVLHYDFNSVWVVDNQSILYRDNSRTYYLVTLKAACDQLTHRGRGFSFHPENPWRLEATHSYEVRPEAGPRCDVARIAQIGDDQANTLRETADRRTW